MIAILLITSVFLGVFLGKYFGNQQKFAKNLLILSAGFLITICLNEIFPQVYQANHLEIGLWVIGGVLLQMLLENLTKGFEHGHIHHPTEKGILPLALVIGLFIHAFIEGIPLALENNPFSSYLQGILFHNLPISFILGAFLFKNRFFNKSSWLIVFLFALASPLGLFLGKYIDLEFHLYFLAIVGGIFLHISSVIIFESNKNHKTEWLKMVLVLLGVGLALFTHVFHKH